MVQVEALEAVDLVQAEVLAHLLLVMMSSTLIASWLWVQILNSRMMATMSPVFRTLFHQQTCSMFLQTETIYCLFVI